MINLKASYITQFLLLVCIVLQTISCYSPTEGCLDPEATNYAITADNDCVDCCTYPELSLSIFHESMDTTFNLGDTITNDIGQDFVLLSFVYLLSDFKVFTMDSFYEVSNTVNLLGEDGVELTVKDDIIRVSRSTFTYELGTIIFNSTAVGLSFKIGLSTELNENRFSEEISGHPLTTDPDSLYQEDTDSYVFQRIQVAQGEGFLDTVIYDVITETDVLFDIDVVSNRGEDKGLIIEAQYDEWFSEIDFETMDKTAIEEKIASNSKFIFKQKE